MVFNYAKLPEIEYKSPAYSNALCDNIFVRIWDFPHYFIKKQISKPFEPLRQFSCLWVILCQAMSV